MNTKLADGVAIVGIGLLIAGGCCIHTSIGLFIAGAFAMMSAYGLYKGTRDQR
jgi:hypothetical protein